MTAFQTLSVPEVRSADMPAPFASFRYRAYGLDIASEVELAELEPAAFAEPDVSIGLRSVKASGLSTHSAYRFGADRQLFSWDGVGRFLIRGTTRIDIDPAPGVDQRLVAFPLLGPVMGLLLHLRGLLVLHASAIEIGGRGVVFVGNKRAGKSTTAGALVAAGHRLLSDDVVVLDMSDPAAPSIRPAFPQLKLAEDARTALQIEGALVREKFHPLIEKRQLRLAEGYCRENVPLRRVYALERREDAAAVECDAADALSIMLGFSYVALFQRSAMGATAARHLHDCSAVAGAGIVRRLRVPAGLSRLGEAVRTVERDICVDGRTD